LLTAEIIEHAKVQAAERKDLPLINSLRLETMDEGLCAQVLYIGPYAAEGPTIIRLHNYIEENGYKTHGKHTEIYLSDMRRTAPEKLKTIIRQPITK